MHPPLENVDGAIAPIIMLVFFLMTGTIKSIRSMVSGLDFLGILLVIASVILIGRIEQKLAAKLFWQTERRRESVREP